MQRHFGALIECAHGHGEMPATGITLVQSRTVGVALQALDFLYLATGRAVRTIGPALGFEVGAGFVFVMENGVGDACYDFYH